LTSGFVEWHTGADIFVNVELKMAFEFVAEVTVPALPAEGASQPQ
jgi:hypothetical protein